MRYFHNRTTTWVTISLLVCSLAIPGLGLAPYLSPVVLGAERKSVTTSPSNLSRMNDKNYNDLDGSTRNFLAAIEHVGVLYESQSVLRSEEAHVRDHLRFAFQQYFSVLLATEENYGVAATKRAREVVEDSIADFMESQGMDSMYDTPIVDDLDAYSKVMTETLIRESVLTM
jgi:hypothetical protein